MTPPPGPGASLGSVVLVEDDAVVALEIEEMLTSAGLVSAVTWVKSLADAERTVDDEVTCVLLDLSLPDASGIEAVERMVGMAPHTAVIALAGPDEAVRGGQSLAAGAQDYLVKSELDERLLARSIQYAVERRRADETARRLYEAQARRVEAARLERGLLPKPRLRSKDVEVATWYRSGTDRTLLSGDFFDVVELDDGRLSVLIGDVAGHGPDEAALGVQLRVAWRGLMVAGIPVERAFAALDEVLVAERSSEEVFATACAAVVAADRRSAIVVRAGHPSPLRFDPSSTQYLDCHVGPALGLLDRFAWTTSHVRLDAGWTMVLYTDGLVEGRDRVHGVAPSDRLGADGLLRIAIEAWSRAPRLGPFVREVVAEAEVRHGGGLPDDVAVVALRDLLPHGP